MLYFQWNRWLRSWRLRNDGCETEISWKKKLTYRSVHVLSTMCVPFVTHWVKRMGFGLLTHTHTRTPTHTAPPLQGLCSCRISSSQQRTGFCPCQSKITGPHRGAEHAATQSDWNPTKNKMPVSLVSRTPSRLFDHSAIWARSVLW